MKPNSRRGVEDEHFGQAREVHGHQRGDEQELGGRITVGDGVDAVGGDGFKAELVGQELAVDGEGRAGHSARAEGQDGGALAELGQALAVAGQRPEVRQPPVAEQDGLRLLEVGVTGQEHAHIGFGALDQRGLHQLEVGIHPVDGVQQPQGEVGGHLVVAAAPGVQLAAHRPGQLGQPPLDGGVHILVGGRVLELRRRASRPGCRSGL